MDIQPNEISSVEEAGMLDGSPVKLIRTKGGFWISVGKPKGKMREEALAAGSHPAIVRYNLEKQFPQFQPALMKSEAFNQDIVVAKHTQFLSEELQKSGYDIYSIQKDQAVSFQLTKHNVKVNSVSATIMGDTLSIKGMSIPKELSKAFASAASEKTLSTGLKKVEIKVA